MDTKELNDPVTIFKMIETLYKQFPVFTLINGKPLQVKIMAIKNQGLFIQSPDDNPNPAERVLVLTNAGNLLHFKFKVSTKDPRGIELLYPVQLVIKTATRTTNRYQATGKVPLYITNSVGQAMIAHDLTDDTMKVESILKPYVQKLKGKFTDVEFFVHERMDTRARLMADTGKHIFVPDTKSPDSVKEGFIPYNEYIHLMKQGKGSSKYLSEICVPLKYKNIVLYGYLQILHLEKTDVNDYNLVLHAANKICKEIMDSEIFNESRYNATIMDISSTGFSFSHPQSKHFGKIFSIGGTLLFDMFEGDKNLGTFRAVVRNIKPLEKLFRIGCQFFHMADENKIIDELIKKYFPESLEQEETETSPKVEALDTPKEKEKEKQKVNTNPKQTAVPENTAPDEDAGTKTS